LLDPVYSGRAFYGMLDHLENKKPRNNSNILFWHTGGLPANFYYSKELR
jgi:1-aminocyclopropane-1-carboxylate deaminase/D-cysteine desulfhydrase-like pyridoxal-dependent ACC family enzyme